MNKTVSSVIDDINEWENPRGGSVFYVTAIFTDETVGSVGRKDQDAALEVQGLLREAIGQPLDFTLEPKGKTQSGREKFKILGFGTPGGAATYTAPGVQGGPGNSGETPRSRPGRASPEHDQFIQERMDRRTALMQACVVNVASTETRLLIASDFYKWLRETSEPASSAYAPQVDDASTSTSPAGVGSEDREEGVESEGKEPAPSSHIHDWQQRQGISKFLVCDCGATRKKEDNSHRAKAESGVARQDT